MSELAADGVPVAVTCRVLGIARQAYYRWRSNPVTSTEYRQAQIANAVFDAHRGDPEFGCRLLADQASSAGHSASERTIWRICAANGWWASFSRKNRGHKSRKPALPVREDLVRRRFTAEGPNRLWLTDLTEHATGQGKLYVCAIKDAWSNRIVGYSIDERMTSQLVLRALESAVARRGDVAGCRLHSDRAGQFRAGTVARVLARHRLHGSMGQVGTSADNAAMESFFSLLQNNVLNRRRWESRQQLRTAIVSWIERTYHRRRRQVRLGQLTPVEFETIMSPTAGLAA